MGAHGAGRLGGAAQSAVWVPAGVEHGIEMAGTVWFRRSISRPKSPANCPRRCCAVNVSPLLRELILHTMKLGLLDREHSPRARLIGFLSIN